jgi:hypothetical protein
MATNTSSITNSNQPTRQLTGQPSKKTSTDSYSPSDSSPTGSMHVDSPEVTCFSPVTALTSVNPSMVAHHGSDHPAHHDLNQAPDLTDSAYFTRHDDKAPRDWTERVLVIDTKLDDPVNQAKEGVKGNEGVVRIENDHEAHIKPTLKNSRVIALDFDDVCCQNLLAMCTEHNAVYGTDLTL